MNIRTLEVFVGALIAIGISNPAQAGEPSPVLVETTAFTEVDALTAGIGASLRKTEKDGAFTFGADSGVSVWTHATYHNVDTTRAIGSGRGYEVSLGIEKRVTPEIAIGLAISKQEFDFDAKTVEAVAVAPYLSANFGDKLLLDAAIGISETQDRPFLTEYGREFAYVRLGTHLKLGSALSVEPFVSHTFGEQDRTSQSRFEVDRTRLGADFIYDMGTMDLLFGVAWEHKDFRVFFPNIPSTGENYETDSPAITLGGSRKIGNSDLTVSATFQEFQQDTQSVSLGLTFGSAY
ncbi:MAG: hypothetical protein GKR99_07160 [Rhodobacteraceae bacterium]|nr:hypothetical protein [Paracoccaceae bacterium]